MIRCAFTSAAPLWAALMSQLTDHNRDSCGNDQPVDQQTIKLYKDCLSCRSPATQAHHLKPDAQDSGAVSPGTRGWLGNFTETVKENSKQTVQTNTLKQHPQGKGEL